MSDKLIRQNTGFIKAEAKRAQEDLERAKEFRDAGNDRAAKAFQTRADTHMGRVEKAASTILNRTKSK
ncbi:hypothetical protein ACM64Y_20395 [Novispirillum sp. DQ9]|uniref:hypothetical protein n=1 Tax=Novispirillum sp. DQ9 TaxID=3398612 RepID=UPI003C7AE6EF